MYKEKENVAVIFDYGYPIYDIGYDTNIVETYSAILTKNGSDVIDLIANSDNEYVHSRMNMLQTIALSEESNLGMVILREDDEYDCLCAKIYTFESQEEEDQARKSDPRIIPS